MTIHATHRPARRRRRDGRPQPGWLRARPRLELIEDRTLLSTVPSTFVVSSTADSGPGSLRQAIVAADATPGPSTIDFDIPGSGVQTIAPQTELPAITAAILIDGFSQPGYSGTPLIALNGSQMGSGDGLLITGPDATVRGLDLGGFSAGAGIHVTSASASGNWIYGNEIGTDPSGTQAEPNEAGVLIDAGASGNTIGGAAAGSGNVISGNNQNGVLIDGAGTNSNCCRRE